MHATPDVVLNGGNSRYLPKSHASLHSVHRMHTKWTHPSSERVQGENTSWIALKDEKKQRRRLKMKKIKMSLKIGLWLFKKKCETWEENLPHICIIWGFSNNVITKCFKFMFRLSWYNLDCQFSSKLSWTDESMTSEHMDDLKLLHET